MEIAQKLSIDLKNSKRIHFSGIEDSSTEGYVDNILLGVGIFFTGLVFGGISDDNDNIKFSA